MELQVNLKEWLKKLVYMKTEVDTKLSSKADSNHTHSISNVTNLQTTLNGKANVSHTHNDTYYTKSEVDARIGDIETALTNILGV